MARDPLQILLSIRRTAVEQARSALGACLRIEAEVVERIRAVDEAVRRDHEASASWQETRMSFWR